MHSRRQKRVPDVSPWRNWPFWICAESCPWPPAACAPSGCCRSRWWCCGSGSPSGWCPAGASSMRRWTVSPIVLVCLNTGKRGWNLDHQQKGGKFLSCRSSDQTVRDMFFLCASAAIAWKSRKTPAKRPCMDKSVPPCPMLAKVKYF